MRLLQKVVDFVTQRLYSLYHRGHGAHTGIVRLRQEGALSRQGMEEIVERALADESFRAVLFANPRVACAPFDITEQEFLELLGQALPASEDSHQPQVH